MKDNEKLNNENSDVFEIFEWKNNYDSLDSLENLEIGNQMRVVCWNETAKFEKIIESFHHWTKKMSKKYSLFKGLN